MKYIKSFLYSFGVFLFGIIFCNYIGYKAFLDNNSPVLCALIMYCCIIVVVSTVFILDAIRNLKSDKSNNDDTDNKIDDENE